MKVAAHEKMLGEGYEQSMKEGRNECETRGGTY
jgi:hypothetical protein